MTDNYQTCIDPYLDSFARSFAVANYKARTIKAYRHLARKLGRLMDTAGIEPSALTPDLADQLARAEARGADNKTRFHHFARRFAEHLIDIGVAPPVPLTEAQAARVKLLADFETYLVKQRGLSSRSIYHVLRFADRFLELRFGNRMIDLRRLRSADAISFVQHVLARRTPYRDKTVTTHLRTFFQYLFACGATATNLALSIPKAAQRWDARLPGTCRPMGWRPFSPRYAETPGMARATMRCCCSWRGLVCARLRSSRSSSTISTGVRANCWCAARANSMIDCQYPRRSAKR